MLILLNCRHKTRVHIGQLVKDTSAKLKQASETDHHADVSVSFKELDISPHPLLLILMGIHFQVSYI